MPKELPTEIIHIDWEGPMTVEEAISLADDQDYGLYTIYGAHSIYGRSVLLYIGQANGRTFDKRIREHRWWLDFNQDAKQVHLYVGRLGGEVTPSNNSWAERIDQAERLLIYACRPAYNTQQELGALEPRLQNVHILNWGSYCDLPPEVSGARWSSKYDDTPNYHVFGSIDD